MKINIEKLKQEKSLKELLEFGILNIDKPAGMTSFDVSDAVRKKLKLRKTSHFGTLDPMVTGVLPIALNRAVKLTGFFLGEDKEYSGMMRIHKEIPMEEIQKVINEKFLGKIMQKPPVKSRVKRQEREREIKSFSLLSQKGKDIIFETEVQGGTYIRKLISDLGEYMGIGMHMAQLRRTQAGIFKAENSVPLKDIENFSEEELRKRIIPAEIVSQVYEPAEINDKDLKHIFTGKPIHKNDLIHEKKFEKGEIISVFSESKFIGMYKIVNECDIIAKPMFVIQPI